MTIFKRKVKVERVRAIAKEFDTGNIIIIETDRLGFNNFMVQQTDYEIIDVKRFQ